MISAAGILIVNAANEVLLLRRTDVGDAAGLWGIPGGRQEPEDADLEATARREAEEELGPLPEQALIAHLRPGPWTRRARDGVDFTTFLARVPDRFEPTLNEEHDAFKWVPLAELMGDQMTVRADEQGGTDDVSRLPTVTTIVDPDGRVTVTRAS